jgi:hypothetical protein
MTQIPSHQLFGDFLATTHMTEPQARDALTLWPLVWPEDAPLHGPDYIGLAVALEHARILIDEVDAGGQVPHVGVTNRHDKAVLFLFGEEIVGAKQNRVANASFLVPAGKSVVLDVSCVEAGRWDRGKGGGFRGSASVVSHSLRQRMGQQVARSVQHGTGFRADQADVWDQVSTRLHSSGTDSRTSAYSDYRASRGPDLEALERGFQSVPRQVGFVAAIGGEIVGVEAIGRPDVFAASFQSLLRAYAIDALDRGLLEAAKQESGAKPRFDEPGAFLAALANASVRETDSLGLGADLRIDTKEVAACALASDGLVHLTAFPNPADPTPGRRMRPWRRRSGRGTPPIDH